ncbi:MAG: hypothetical protein CML60_03555 [Rhodobacteraceae bacterium]|nr:hypothetical protein [Paracoccaceae bacterium]
MCNKAPASTKSELLCKIRGQVDAEWQEVLMLPVGSNVIGEIDTAVELSENNDASSYLLSMIYEKFESV